MIIITIMINHYASLLVQKTNSVIGPGPVQLKYKQLEGKITLNEISKCDFNLAIDVACLFHQ